MNHVGIKYPIQLVQAWPIPSMAQTCTYWHHWLFSWLYTISWKAGTRKLKTCMQLTPFFSVGYHALVRSVYWIWIMCCAIMCCAGSLQVEKNSQLSVLNPSWTYYENCCDYNYMNYFTNSLPLAGQQLLNWQRIQPIVVFCKSSFKEIVLSYLLGIATDYSICLLQVVDVNPEASLLCFCNWHVCFGLDAMRYGPGVTWLKWDSVIFWAQHMYCVYFHLAYLLGTWSTFEPIEGHTY